MIEWSDDHRRYVRAHLNTDMTAAELARVFMVKPADIWQLAISMKMPIGNASPIVFHSPGGGALTAILEMPFATAADAYQPMDHDNFQRLYRGPDWKPDRP